MNREAPGKPGAFLSVGETEVLTNSRLSGTIKGRARISEFFS
jgi:hypothetical protein